MPKTKLPVAQASRAPADRPGDRSIGKHRPRRHTDRHQGRPSMTRASIIFYDWPYSPFCMKVRAMLDHKGLQYERINPLGRALFAIHRRGKIGKVPALEID